MTRHTKMIILTAVSFSAMVGVAIWPKECYKTV